MRLPESSTDTRYQIIQPPTVELIENSWSYMLIVDGNCFMLDKSFHGFYKTEIILDGLAKIKGYYSRKEWIQDLLSQANQVFDLI